MEIIPPLAGTKEAYTVVSKEKNTSKDAAAVKP